MYRILTERKNPEKIKAILRLLGLDYTVYMADGAWQGTPEASMAIELDGTPWNTILLVSLLIKLVNKQSAVLIQIIPVRSFLV